MYYSISDGIIAFGDKTVISGIHFEIKDKQKIAVVGRNGCGKTTLLRLINGEVELEKGTVSKNTDTVIGYLKQIAFENDNETFEVEVKKAFSKLFEMKKDMEDLLEKLRDNPADELVSRYSSLEEHFKLLGGYYYQKEYETVVSKFGFTKHDTTKKLSEFSGGQRTKIAFIKLLLSKPDILLLDEPTNHLDIETVEWLEEYLISYPCAVVIVSHDRMFLDRVVNTVYEIEYGEITRYNGNYSKFCELKKNDFDRRKKEYQRYQAEVRRLNELIERFRYKATKASMVQSKIKTIERMAVCEEPEQSDQKRFYMDITPQIQSGDRVLEICNLAVGYEKQLAKVSLVLNRGKKLGVIGGNGLGKSTLLKTLISSVKALSGEFRFGINVKIGYFDQNLAQYVSDKTVLEDYWDEYPSLTMTQVRNDLGAFLFRGEDVFKPVNVLSGGEKVRLSLCKIFKKKPNLLILDEPTNHMDMVGKETLEEMLKGYIGTVICVSHDRYFIKQICDSLLVFENGGVVHYPFGYSEYESRRNRPTENIQEKYEVTSVLKEKKKNNSPLKELSRVQTALKRNEKQIEELENEISRLKILLELPENVSDFEKLSEFSDKIESLENKLGTLYEEWEELSLKKQHIEFAIENK